MVADGSSVGYRRLGRADVEPSVDRHGVDTHDLGTETAGERDREGRFPGGRWPCEKPAVVSKNRANRAGGARGAC